MPEKVKELLKSWSHHTYTMYMNCPQSVYFERVLKIKRKEDRSKEMDFGDEAHKKAQQFVGITTTLLTPAPIGKHTLVVNESEGIELGHEVVAPKGIIGTVAHVNGRYVDINGKLKKALSTGTSLRFRQASKKVPEELEGISKTLVKLRNANASPELQLAFDKNWNMVDWFSSEAWVRAKLDAMNVTNSPPHIYVVDYKTGKVRPDHVQQRSLYALCVLQMVKLGKLCDGNPKTTLTVEHLYMATGQHGAEDFTMKDLEPLRKEWAKRTEQMLTDTVYPAFEGFHCKWCKFAKSKGGPCTKNR
jgi:CRISPR/Cas system-associated exonuclease Cas4 (RecB family)